jgi:hypothetical protein
MTLTLGTRVSRPGDGAEQRHIVEVSNLNKVLTSLERDGVVLVAAPWWDSHRGRRNALSRTAAGQSSLGRTGFPVSPGATWQRQLAQRKLLLV